MKEQDKTLEKDVNATEISDLPDSSKLQSKMLPELGILSE